MTSLLNAAQQLAAEHSHQQLTPVHLAIVMFGDPEGVARAALAKQAASEDTLNSVLRMLRRALVRLPAVASDDGGGEVYLAPDLKKALQAAAKLQKAKGDSFLGAALLLGLAGGWLCPPLSGCRWEWRCFRPPIAR